MNARRGLRVAGCVAVLLAGIVGCPQDAPPVDDSTLPAASTAPTTENVQSLKQVSEQYAALIAGTPALEARAALIDTLNNATPGVASAGLANDNYTIVMAFESGAHAAINTIEGFGSGAAYDPAAMTAKLIAANKQATAAKALSGTASATTKVPGAGDLLHTPTSRKILLMSAASEDLAGADLDLFEGLMTKLVIENHWDPDDIVIKTNRAGDDYATLRFSDFFNLDDYGVIIILAHGLYMDVVRPATTDDGATEVPVTDEPAGSDPFNFGFKAIRTMATAAATRVPHFYIQVAAAGPVITGSATGTVVPAGSDPYGFGFKRINREASIDGIDIATETARGRLMIASHAFGGASAKRPYYYLRDDLWSEHIGTLPNSLVYIGAPNGYADPDATWPELIAAGSSGTADPASVPAGTDPFNFGFKTIIGRTARTMTAGAGSVFQGKNPGTVLAWTGAVDTQTALDAVGLSGLMAGRNQSDREVWDSGDIVRTAARAGVPRTTGTPPPTSTPSGADPFGFGFKTILSALSDTTADDSAQHAKLALHSKFENAFLYLPCWADLTVLDPLPDGTVQIVGTIEYENADIPPLDPGTFDGTPSDTFSFDGLIPGQKAIVKAEARDSAGEVLSGFEQTYTLQTGGNPIELSFVRELSVTLSGSPVTDGNWGAISDLSHPQAFHCTGFKLLVRKNGTLLSPNYIRLTDRYTSQIYPQIHMISHNKILSYSGWNPAYPGDTISIEFHADPNEGNSAIIGPLYLHYWNDYVHEVIEVGTVSAYEGTPVTRTFTLGK